MENKNNVALFSLSFLVVGIFVGWLIWGINNMSKDMMSRGGMHQMMDGSMMSNSTDMGAMMASMNVALMGKTGDSFDKAFLSEMIVHHEGAVSMAEMVLTNSNRPELKKLANDIISAQNKEIQMMKDWQSTWFK
jgi:uncharacterized protein (DUF305 family)